MKVRRAVSIMIVAALATVLTPAAGAQSTRERALQDRMAAAPGQLNPILELAALYNELGRFEDAERMLGQAVAVVRTLRAAAAADAAGKPVVAQMPVRVGGNIPEPKKIKNVNPVYPAVAQEARVSGMVILEATIDGTGRVVHAKVIRSVALLDQAAIDAVLQWEFTPTHLNGAPVPVIMTVTVNFTLR